MWPILFDLGVVRITAFGLGLAAGFAWGSFVLWRNLGDDYGGEELLTLWLWLTIAAWVGSGAWVWWTEEGRQIFGAVVLPALVLVGWSRRQKWNFWELLDAWAPVSLGVMVLASLGWGPAGGWPALAAIGGVVGTSVVAKLYRRWRWYKSGKRGVVGVVALAWWAVVNLVVAKFSLWAVYSLGWAAVVALVVVYLRSGRHIRSDFARLWPKKT